MSYTKAESISALPPLLQDAEGRLVRASTEFELIINLKAAKQIGLMIPQSMPYRADKVIK